MSITSIISQLESTTSRKEKIKILEQNKDNKILEEILKYTYDPTLQFYVKKIEVPQNYGKETIENSWSSFKQILERLVNRDLSGNSAQNVLLTFFETIDEETYEIYQQIINKKFLKAAINVNTVNKAFNKDIISHFDIQLANMYDLTNISYPSKFYCSPKLDGIRCIYFANKELLFTRTGNIITICPNILQDCKQICEKYSLDFIDGELWSKSFDFNTIQSAVMSNKNLKPELSDQITLNIFAVGSPNISDTTKMVHTMNEISKEGFNYVKIVKQILIKNDLNIIVNLTIAFIQQGYEGIMLRNPNINYSWKRDDNLLKVKEFQLREIYDKKIDNITSAAKSKLKSFIIKRHILLTDFFINKIEEGQGNFSGMLGSVIVEGRINNRVIISKVGSGFKLDERKSYWKIKDQLIGKEVEILCQEITKDGSLRFPILKAIKLDR